MRESIPVRSCAIAAARMGNALRLALAANNAARTGIALLWALHTARFVLTVSAVPNAACPARIPPLAPSKGAEIACRIFLDLVLAPRSMVAVDLASRARSAAEIVDIVVAVCARRDASMNVSANRVATRRVTTVSMRKAFRFVFLRT